AHVLPRTPHPGGKARAQAPLLGARPVVPHRQAGVPIRHPADPEMGRQRRPGPKTLITATRPRAQEENRMTTLAGKTLFITGASRGIGRAIALRVARDGANIAIVAKSGVPNPKLPSTIHTGAEEVGQAGGMALPVQCDISEEEQLLGAVAVTVAEFGGLDILVNNDSAIWRHGTLGNLLKRFDPMQQVNARGIFLCA